MIRLEKSLDWLNGLVFFFWQRINEQDPLIGVVPIELGKIFKNASQSTSWYPLSGGLGSGRLRASILFRSINYQLPPSLRGYDVGTAKIFDRIVLHAHKEETAHTLKGCYIKLRTIAGKASVSAWRASSGTKEDGDDHKSVTWSLGEKHSPIRLPVRRRYASALIIELRAKNPIRKTLIWAVSAFWVNEVLDDERMRIKIPLWDGRDQSAYKRVTQNWHSYENMDERAENPPLGTLIGTLEVDFEFSRGVDSLHARAANKLPEAKPVIDAWR